MDNKKQHDILRDDKFYEIKIPSYYYIGGSVFYQVYLKDLIRSSQHICSFRFNDFKVVYENLSKLKVPLPQFPKTHLWKKTNKNPKMIQQRKLILQKFFNTVANAPFTRGSKDIKNFIHVCKSMEGNRLAKSLRKKTVIFPQQKGRRKSLSQNSHVEVSAQILKHTKK